MKRRQLGTEGSFYCNGCNYNTNIRFNYLRHLSSDRHTKNEILMSSGSPATEPKVAAHVLEEDAEQLYRPTSCSTDVENSFDDYHRPPNKKPYIDHTDVSSNNNSDHEEENEFSTPFPNSENENTTLQWFPFKSKLEMLLYILLHSKTHTLSDETAKFIWFIMQESGIDMPSFSSMKNMSFGDLTVESLLNHCEGKDGTPFWFMKPSALIKLAVSHPETSLHLIRYGRFSSDGTIAEQADGMKWKFNMQSLSAKKGDTIYYKGDFVVDSRTNRIGKIHNFLQNRETENLHAELEMFEKMEHNGLICPGSQCNKELIDLEYLLLINPEEYRFYTYDEENIQLNILSSADQKRLTMENTFKDNNHLTHVVPVNIFLDDTSSNKSKKWKPLHCIQQQLSGLPMSVRQQSTNIKFIAASTDVPILDMVKEVVQDLTDIKQNGVAVYDAKQKEMVKVTTELALCVCDFSMMAEASNHMGPNTQKFCPRCNMDDIKTHGPPAAYSEDAFEKMHGRIRDQLFVQNQHARSRDTATAFAEMEILNHVTTGGYFLKDDEWVQASPNVLQFSNHHSVANYLGNPSKSNNKNESGSLLKSERSATKKIIWKSAVSETADFTDAARDHMMLTEECKVARYKAVKCKNGDIVNTGKALLFKDEQNKECLGIFEEGFNFLPPKGRNVELAKIRILEKIHTGVEDMLSEKYHVTNSCLYVSPNSILGNICLIHDCFEGGCHLKECLQQQRMEQESKNIMKTVWQHNFRHKYYYLNKYRF